MVSRDERVYLGVNVEFSGQPLVEAIHAEQCAIVNAVLHGASPLVALASSATPCGHCRQFCQELHAASLVRFVVDASLQSRSLADLLPLGFGPSDLGVADHALLAHLAHRVDAHEPLRWLTAAPAAASAAQLAQLVAEAVRAFGLSYAPYSLSASGVALLLADGSVVCGPYIESCAFNPSLTPVRAALAAAVLRDAAFGSVRAAVLVERQGAKASHALETQTLLAAVAAEAAFGVVLVSAHTDVPRS